MICEKCNKDFVEDSTDDFLFCKECLSSVVKICCCSKEFMDKPNPLVFVVPKKDGYEYKEYLETEIPTYFFEKLNDHLYHIMACRGCKLGTISVQDNFKEALVASIYSCVFQQLTKNEITNYEYLSDSLDPEFEEYLLKNGISVGESLDIKLE